MTTIVAMGVVGDNRNAALRALQCGDQPYKMRSAMPHSQCFRRVHRITKSSEFERAYRVGKLIQNEHFRIYALAQEGQRPPRLGLSVTKRLGKAQVRNRLKRWIREWFRSEKSEFSHLALVVQPKPPAAQLNHQTLQDSLRKLMASLKESASF